ncbi:hypothetical protein [Caldinitratiruptor microaerophilus]|uniref:hypothetical protein n=1 Tax=Caldinitratiruptor microaerophilus TaxID=671077 RepID=UPI0022304098|nr:hypothetical protein [Caldinitratiruptor microaerophilus]
MKGVRPSRDLQWLLGPVRPVRRRRVQWLPLVVAVVVALALRQVSMSAAQIGGGLPALRLPGPEALRDALLDRVCGSGPGRR